MAAIVGCSSTATKPPSLTDIDVEDNSLSTEERLSHIDAFIAAQAFSDANEHLQMLIPNQLSDSQYTDYLLYRTAIAIARNDIEQAQSDLNVLADKEKNLRQERYAGLLKAQLLEAQHEYLSAARERDFIAELLSEAQYDSNHEQLWQDLLMLSEPQLNHWKQTLPAGRFQQWVQLALASKQSNIVIDEQLQAVNRWRFDHPQHPASKQLPGGLGMLAKLANERPQRIALLLPLTGPRKKAGNAIRDGFMAAYFDAMQKNHPLPNIQLIDSNGQSLSESYQQAHAAQAQWVVGPVAKKHVLQLNDHGLPALQPTTPTGTDLAIHTETNPAGTNHTETSNAETTNAPSGTQADPQSSTETNTLASADDTPTTPQDGNIFEENPASQGANTHSSPSDKLSLPTLALNYANLANDSSAPEHSGNNNLFQFGLAGEDEAIQIAHLAWQEGRRNVLILAPAGAWGERITEAFEQHWLALGGRIGEKRLYPRRTDYSPDIRALLNVDDSRKRFKAVRQALGESIDFEPRRRQDIDWVFMVSLPKQGRLIKPTLAFNFAGDLPVYATSHVYTGQENTTKDRDLNNIRFCDIPWVLAPNDIANTVANAVPKQGIYSRLYALGVDAYRVLPRLPQLQRYPSSKLYGSTGELMLDTNQRIRRSGVCARFAAGKPKLIQEPTLAKTP